MNKKGFTLVELLAVIAILALLVIIALPNIMDLFSNAKKNSFENEVKNIYKTVEEQVMVDSFKTPNASEITYSSSESSSNHLPLKGRSDLKYCVVVNGANKITKLYVSDGQYLYISEDIDELSNIENIHVDEVLEGDLSDIENCVTQPTDPSLFRYTLTDGKADIIGIDALVIEDSQKCLDYLNNNVERGCAPFTSICNATDVLVNTCSGTPQSFLITNVPKSDYAKAGLKVKNIERLIIPSEIDGYSVNSIKGFNKLKLLSVKIQDGVKKIEDYAFLTNKISSVVIPNSVISIGKKSFNENRLRGNNAFIYARTDTNNDGIAEIDNTTLISYGGTNNDVVIPNGVTTLNNNSFDGAKIKSVIIPDTVTSIGNYAFNDNELTSVTIPNSVTTIGIAAFSNNQLTSVTLSGNISIIDENAFSNNKISTITIPNGVTSIKSMAFASNELTSVTIPNGVTVIGERAFYSNHLESVTIPSSVVKLENIPFYENNLRSVIIKGKSSSSSFTTYNPGWGWASDVTCTKDNTSNVTNGCITWNAS